MARIGNRKTSASTVEVHDSFANWAQTRSSLRVPVGFVPTMGALHDGHAALIRRARMDMGKDGHVVVSVYVNPTQFNDPGDFEAYPNTREEDTAVAMDAGADAVVFPEAVELYPGGVPLQVEATDYGSLTALWEAAHRPGHFDGVVAVVRRLFSLVRPDRAFFGEKDWQQLAVISELVRREFGGLTIVPVPTVREADGLAMSSRNVRLSPTDRPLASVLYGALQAVAESDGHPKAVDDQVARLRSKGWDVEYFAVVDAMTLEPEPQGSARRAIVAAQWGGVRLIDNLPVPN